MIFLGARSIKIFEDFNVCYIRVRVIFGCVFYSGIYGIEKSKLYIVSFPIFLILITRVDEIFKDHISKESHFSF